MAALAPPGRRRRAVPHGVPGPPAAPARARCARDAGPLASAPRPPRDGRGRGPGASPRRLARGGGLSGGVFGLSGFMLGAVLFPVFHGAAWAPLAVERFLALVAAPSRRRVAGLALVLAVQAATLGAEAVVATALFAVALVPRWPGRRAALATGGSLLLAAALAAPLLFGMAAVLGGSARGQGFAPEVGLSYSTPWPALLEGVLPRFFGDPHTFSDVGYWGQPFYPNGSPYFLSLYLGPVVLALAARAGWRGRGRLWGLAVLGVLISLGVHGPLGPFLAPLMGPLRGAVKFSLLTTLAVALLAGSGSSRSGAEGSVASLAPPGAGSSSPGPRARRRPCAVLSLCRPRPADPCRRRSPGPARDRVQLAARPRGHGRRRTRAPGSRWRAAGDWPRSPASSRSSTSCASTASSTLRRTGRSTTCGRRWRGRSRRPARKACSAGSPTASPTRRPSAGTRPSPRATRTCGSSTSTARR